MSSTAEDTAAAKPDAEADADTCSCFHLPHPPDQMPCSVHTKHQAQTISVPILADGAQQGTPEPAESGSEATQTGFPVSLDAIFNIKLKERYLYRSIISGVHTALTLAQRVQAVGLADKDTEDPCAQTSTVQAGMEEVSIQRSDSLSVSSLDAKKIAITIQAYQWHTPTPSETIRRITCKDPSLLHDLQSYRPDAAATRYACLLHDCAFDFERGIDVAGAVHRSYAAYDWNATYSLECDVLKPVVAARDDKLQSTEVTGAHGTVDRQDYRHARMVGNANGSVMPMPHVGRVILMGVRTVSLFANKRKG